VKYPVVHIVWDDACSDSGWQSAKEVKWEAQLVYTTGYLISESKDYVLIGHTYSGDDFVGWFQIPKRMIVSRKTLVRAKRR
jgi:hypothetical protein